MGHAADDGGPVGVAVAVVRGRELYVATVGPAEAYLIRQARLSTLPDPNRDRGLPVEGLEPEVWRGELSVGDSLCLVSANIVAKIGTDALKDALVTLHPQSAIEHLHARFVAADGKGSDGALAFEANEVGATYKSKSLVPVRPAEPLAGAPDKSPIPLADTVDLGRGGDRRRGDAGEERRGQRLPARDLADPGPAAASQDRRAQGHRDRVADGGAATGGRRPARVRRRGRRPRARRVRGRRPAAAPGRHQVADGRGERVRCRQGGPRERDRPRRRPHQRRPQPGPRAPQPRLPAARPRRERRLPHRADRAAARDRPVRARPHLPGDLDQVVAAVHVPQGQAGPADGPRPRARWGAVRARHRGQDRVADRPRQEDGDAGPQVRASGPRRGASPTRSSSPSAAPTSWSSTPRTSCGAGGPRTTRAGGRWSGSRSRTRRRGATT